MTQVFSFPGRAAGCLALGGALMLLTGCGYHAPQFRENEGQAILAERKASLTLTDDQKTSVNNVLVALFGTPDDPHVPSTDDPALGNVLNETQLQIAAGPVGRNAVGQQHGLYREHCAHCHGVTGDGQGPTGAYLNPYPRDYRKGVYKFKSTPKGLRPTHADLKRTLDEGIPGTAMPSFKLLHDDQVEALIGYVKYLSLRGEVEAKLIDFTLGDDSIEEGEVILDPKWRDSSNEEEKKKFGDRLTAIKGLVTAQFKSWAEAEQMASEIPPRPVHKTPEELAASIKKGNELFHGGIAICIKCHGETALGDGQMTDFDDWTKPAVEEETKLKKAIADSDKTRAAINEEISKIRADKDLSDEDRKTKLANQQKKIDELDALSSVLASLKASYPPPRNIIPRNLRIGNLRGGHRPIDLYWRILNGIDGTPMPAANMRKAGGAATELNLTPEDVWSIVDYVQSLPYEPLSQREHLVENVREDKF